MITPFEIGLAPTLPTPPFPTILFGFISLLCKPFGVASLPGAKGVAANACRGGKATSLLLTNVGTPVAVIDSYFAAANVYVILMFASMVVLPAIILRVRLGVFLALSFYIVFSIRSTTCDLSYGSILPLALIP